MIRGLAISGLLAIYLAGSAVGQDPPPARLSAADLRAQTLAAHAQLDSIYVAYWSDDYDKQRFPEGTYLHREMAAKAPCYFYHVSAHGHHALEWPDDHLMQHTRVLSDRWHTEVPVNRTYFGDVLQRNDPLPGSMPYETYFLATGIWPLSDRPPPRGEQRTLFLGDPESAAEFTQVRPKQELVAQRWCHVLEGNGNNRMWIDVERGWTQMAREWEVGETTIQRLETDDHRELLPGIWLPYQIRNFRYRPSEHTGNRTVLTGTRMDVLEIRVNDLDAEFFDFQPRPGALEIGRNQELKQISSGGWDHLDHLVDWVRRNAPAANRQASLVERYGFLAGLPFLLIVAALEVSRIRRGLRQQNENRSPARAPDRA